MGSATSSPSSSSPSAPPAPTFLISSGKSASKRDLMASMGGSSGDSPPSPSSPFSSTPSPQRPHRRTASLGLQLQQSLDSDVRVKVLSSEKGPKARKAHDEHKVVEFHTEREGGVAMAERDRLAVATPSMRSEEVDSMSSSMSIGSVGGSSHSWFALLYGRYLPFMVRERFRLSPSPLASPEADEFDGAVAFIDISGFTAMSEKLVNAHGMNGAELLNKYISTYFKHLIDIVVDWGGDVVKFAGDAVQVVWRNRILMENILNNRNKGRERETKEGGNESTPSLGSLLLRCVECCLVLLHEMNDVSVGGHELSLHIGCSAGRMKSFYVGGVDDMWEFFVCGEPVKEVGDACDAANSGHLVCHSNVIHLLADKFTMKKASTMFQIIPPADFRPPNRVKFTPPRIDPKEEAALQAFVPPIVRRRLDSGQSSAWLSEFRRCFVMFVALPSFDYTDSFAALPILHEAVRSVQSTIAKFEGTVARLLCDDKGTRFKIAFGMPTMSHEDDSMRVVLAALEIEKMLNTLGVRTCIGIASGSVYCGNAGSEVRCEYTAVGFKVIMAARLMQMANKQTMEGSSSLILVDESIRTPCANRIWFESLAPVKLKGVQQLVNIYRPLGEKKNQGKATKVLGFGNVANGNEKDKEGGGTLPIPSPKDKDFTDGRNSPIDVVSRRLSGPLKAMAAAARKRANSFKHLPSLRDSDSPVGGPADATASMNSMTLSSSSTLLSTALPPPIDLIVGRDSEMDTLLSLLDGVISTGNTSVIVIEGDGGMGKTSLIQKLMKRANVKCHLGVGSAIDSRSPYFVWRQIVEGIFSLNSIAQSTRRMAAIENAVTSELIPWLSLLNPLLGLSFRTSIAVDTLTDEYRGKNLQRLLLSIIGVGHSTTRIFILEDAQSMDSASWDLLEEVSRLIPNVFVVLTSRPLDVEVQPQLNKIFKFPWTHKMKLGEITKSDTAKLLESRLQGVDVPPQLVNFIYDRTRGHPLFTEEICKDLVDKKAVAVDPSTRRVLIIGNLISSSTSQSSSSLNSVAALSDTLQMMLVGRIDRISADIQMTLKAAAVIGNPIKLNMLQFCHPNGAEKDLLRKHLLELSQMGFVSLDPNNAERFFFKNQFYIAAAYSMLSLDQRKELHQLAANFIETSNPNSTNQRVFASLAHHFSFTNQYNKTIHYTASAGKLALSANANHEAVKMFEFVHRILDQNASHIQNAEAVRCINFASLGQAYYNVGKFRLAIQQFKGAMKIFEPAFTFPFRRRGLFNVALNMFVKWNRMKDSYRTWRWKSKGKGMAKEKKTEKEKKSMTADEIESEASQWVSDHKQMLLLLEKLVRSNLLVGDVASAVYCAYKMNEIAFSLSSPTLIALSASLCSIVGRESGRSDWAHQFEMRTREFLETGKIFGMSDDDVDGDVPVAITAGDKSRLSFNSASLLSYDGKWDEMFERLKESKSFYKSGVEFRESTLLQSTAWMLTGKFVSSHKGFSAMRRSATSDGDAHLEFLSHSLLATLEILSVGHRILKADSLSSPKGWTNDRSWESILSAAEFYPNPQVTENIQCCFDIAEDANLSDAQTLSAYVVHQYFHYFNQRDTFLSSRSVGDPEDPPIVDYVEIMAFSVKVLPFIGDPPLLPSTSFTFFILLDLAITVVDDIHNDIVWRVESDGKSTPSELSSKAKDDAHRFRSTIERLLKRFHSYCSIFPFALSMYYYFVGKFNLMLSQIDAESTSKSNRLVEVGLNALDDSIALSESSQLRLVLAKALLEKGRFLHMEAKDGVEDHDDDGGSYLTRCVQLVKKLKLNVLQVSRMDYLIQFDPQTFNTLFAEDESNIQAKKDAESNETPLRFKTSMGIPPRLGDANGGIVKPKGTLYRPATFVAFSQHTTSMSNLLDHVEEFDDDDEAFSGNSSVSNMKVKVHSNRKEVAVPHISSSNPGSESDGGSKESKEGRPIRSNMKMIGDAPHYRLSSDSSHLQLSSEVKSKSDDDEDHIIRVKSTSSVSVTGLALGKVATMREFSREGTSQNKLERERETDILQVPMNFPKSIHADVPPSPRERDNSSQTASRSKTMLPNKVHLTKTNLLSTTKPKEEKEKSAMKSSPIEDPNDVVIPLSVQKETISEMSPRSPISPFSPSSGRHRGQVTRSIDEDEMDGIRSHANGDGSRNGEVEKGAKTMTIQYYIPGAIED